MGVIVPCVTAAAPDDYKASLERIHTFAQRVHIDLSDGVFAPTKLIGPESIWWPQGWEVDVHVMAEQPSLYVPQLIALQPHMITLHVEAKEDIASLLQQIKQAGIKAGIALLKTTVPSDVAALVEAADHVMIFSGDLGRYGGEASLMQLEKIRLVRNINAAAEIGWDGGISIENAFSLAQGGVDVFNVGGAIQKAEKPADAFAALTKEINKQGVM